MLDSSLVSRKVSVDVKHYERRKKEETLQASQVSKCASELSTVVLFLLARPSNLLCECLLFTGEIGFKSSPLTPWLHRIEATDGSAALLAVVSRDHGFITCTRDDSEATVKTIIDDPAAVVEIIGQKYRDCTVHID